LSYKPDPLYDESELGRYLKRELEKLSSLSEVNEVDSIQFKIWHTEPDKPRQGVLYYADGSDFNPLSGGEGLYRHTGSVWVKVG